MISVPNEPFFMLAKFVRGKKVRAWGNDVEHVDRWTAGELFSMVRGYCEVETVAFPFLWVLPVCRK